MMVDAGRQTDRYKWYALALLTAAQGCHALDRAIIGLVLEPVRLEFDLSDSQLGVLAGLSYGLAFALAAIPMGMLVDRVNRKRLLAGALAAWSVLTAVCGLTTSFLSLLVSRIAVGAAESAGPSAGMSLLADYFRPRQRATAVGIWYLSSALGIFGTYLVGGYVAAHYGWRAAFFVAGAPGLLLAGVILATLKEPLRGLFDDTAQKQAPCGPRQGLAYVMRSPQLLLCMGAITLMAVAQAATLTWMTSFLVRGHDFDLTRAGSATAVMMGVMAPVGSFVVALLVDRGNRKLGFSVRRVASACVLTSLVSAFVGVAALLSHSTVMLLSLLGVFTLLQGGHNGSANSLLVGLAGPHVRGFVLATLQVLTNLVGWGLGPLIVGVVSDRIGGPLALQWGLLSVLIFHLLASLHFFLLARTESIAHVASVPESQ
jgi:predicted MFS family arabinose efflux permease